MMLNENLKVGDLEFCISDFISIDEYVSRIDDDNITIAFFCNEKDIAEELKDFIEKDYFIEIADIELSNTITEDNKYLVFVEFERNLYFPKLLKTILQGIEFLTNIDKWSFTTLKHHIKTPLTEENIKKYVRLTKLRDNIADNNENTEKNEDDVKESFSIEKDGIKRNYIIEGYIPEETMNKYIMESESLNNRDIEEIEILENRYYGKNIITTDDKCFIIDKKKILMLSIY